MATSNSANPIKGIISLLFIVCATVSGGPFWESIDSIHPSLLVMLSSSVLWFLFPRFFSRLFKLLNLSVSLFLTFCIYLSVEIFEIPTAGISGFIQISILEPLGFIISGPQALAFAYSSVFLFLCCVINTKSVLMRWLALFL